MARPRCPEHDIPDCSPLLNGCSWQPPKITLPCGCIVQLGSSEYEAVCEPHRLAQEQDAGSTP